MRPVLAIIAGALNISVLGVFGAMDTVGGGGADDWGTGFVVLGGECWEGDIGGYPEGAEGFGEAVAEGGEGEVEELVLVVRWASLGFVGDIMGGVPSLLQPELGSGLRSGSALSG